MVFKKHHVPCSASNESDIHIGTQDASDLEPTDHPKYMILTHHLACDEDLRQNARNTALETPRGQGEQPEF